MIAITLPRHCRGSCDITARPIAKPRRKQRDPQRFSIRPVRLFRVWISKGLTQADS